MNDFHEKTAVITGAASGIGLALASRAAREGMKLVLADIDQKRLQEAAAGLNLPEERIRLCTTDVSQEKDIQRLADEAFESFGAVHLLCNNAGVGMARQAWEYQTADWEWVLGVNLWSVIYSVRHFVPRLLMQAEESHIVNTASAAGLVSTPGMAPYNVSKHGVVTLSETLYYEFSLQKAKVGISVLCPSWVPTGINQSERARPERFGPSSAPSQTSSAYEMWIDRLIRGGELTAADMADAVFKAVAEKQFYIIPHEYMAAPIRNRMENILASRNPTLSNRSSEK